MKYLKTYDAIMYFKCTACGACAKEGPADALKIAAKA
jgi:ferredoxin